ncbi:MAG: HD domain-containing protein [Candidatus Obscuribacterales bacterium]|nr:HD domain-containing protein [Candidatus Obscuribacterales bacterium]
MNSIRNVAFNNFVLPKSQLATEINTLVQECSPAYLYNHCMRTYLFAQALAIKDDLTYDNELLFAGCLMHDLGITERFRGKSRFEVDGADAAQKFLLEKNVDSAKAELIWDAIALHTTTHIPLRKRPEIALVHQGAGADVLGLGIGEFAPELVGEILERFPRANFKKAIIEDFVAYLKQNPQGGQGYWLNAITEKYIPGTPHFTFEDGLNSAPFEE